MIGIEVRFEWNGATIPLWERATLRLSGGDDGLHIDVDAPFGDDPKPPGPPGALDELWNYEVVELFVGGPGDTYVEIELGAHGHHLVLRCEGVRKPTARCLPITYEAGPDDEGIRWHGTAVVPWDLLPAGPHRVAAFAIHGPPKARRYLSSVPLPGPKPDFHQPKKWPALELPR
jgi:hypothetical protein